jgi:hypothetical protein
MKPVCLYHLHKEKEISMANPKQKKGPVEGIVELRDDALEGITGGAGSATTHQKDVTQYNQGVATHNKDVTQYNQGVATHNKDVTQYNHKK